MDPFGTGRTVIRAGAGIIYEQVNWESFLAFNNVYGLGTIPTAGFSMECKERNDHRRRPKRPEPWELGYLGRSTTPPFQIPGSTALRRKLAQSWA